MQLRSSYQRWTTTCIQTDKGAGLDEPLAFVPNPVLRNVGGLSTLPSEWELVPAPCFLSPTYSGAHDELSQIAGRQLGLRSFASEATMNDELP